MSKQIWTDEDLADVERHAEKRGARLERERIIELLEDNYPGRLAGVIALIKGENK